MKAGHETVEEVAQYWLEYDDARRELIDLRYETGLEYPPVEEENVSPRSDLNGEPGGLQPPALPN